VKLVGSMATAFLPPAVLPCPVLRARRATNTVVTASLVDLRSLAVAAVLVLSPSATLPTFLREPTPISISTVALAQNRATVTETTDDAAVTVTACPAATIAAVPGHTALAVVGLSKVRIHDLGTPPEAATLDASLSTSRQPDALRVARTSALPDDPEMAIAARLIPAVLLGALLGTERGALSRGLCVRTLLLVSSVSALVTVSGLASGLAVPRALPVVMLAAATALGAVSAAVATTPLSSPSSLSPLRGVDPRVRGRRRATMTGLAVAASTATLGAACGAGLPLVAAFGYLLAVAVLRLDAHAADLLAGHRGGASNSKRSGGRHGSTRPRLRRKHVTSGDVLASGASVAAVPSVKAVRREQSTIAESGTDSVEPFLFGPRPQPQAQDQKNHPAGRTVLRLAMENSGGAQRIVEVAGSDLDDAIRELKRREWS
jgi:uncharacterized membrane protein YhiD involved in acid resistance